MNCAKKPNLLIHGVGHSGTRLFSRMAEALGWKCGHVKSITRETSEFNRLNKLLFKNRECGKFQAKFLRQLPTPWVIKCTRTVWTLPAWLPYFREYTPTMLYVTRHPNAMANTYKGDIRRKRSLGFVVSDLCQIAREQYEAWPWRKVHLQFEQVAKWALQWVGGNRHKVRREVGELLPCVSDLRAAFDCVDIPRARKSMEAMR